MNEKKYEIDETCCVHCDCCEDIDMEMAEKICPHRCIKPSVIDAKLSLTGLEEFMHQNGIRRCNAVKTDTGYRLEEIAYK